MTLVLCSPKLKGAAANGGAVATFHSDCACLIGSAPLPFHRQAFRFADGTLPHAAEQLPAGASAFFAMNEFSLCCAGDRIVGWIR